MLTVVPQMWPAGNEYPHTFESFSFELAKLPGSFLECSKAIVLRRILCVVAIALRLQVTQNARTHVRHANQIAEERSAGDLFFKGNEQSGIQGVASIPLRHVNVIAARDWNQARGPQIVEAAQLRTPSWTNHGRPTRRMTELISGIVWSFDDHHQARGSFLKSPPRHRPRLNDMTLQQTVIGGCNLSIRSEAANRVVLLGPVSWQQRASTIAQQRVVDVMRVQSAGPVQLPQRCVSLVRYEI